jgi:stress response protein SCP2
MNEVSLNLVKDQKLNLSKESAGLKAVMVGLGWDEVEQKRGWFAPKPAEIDCDASAFLIDGRKSLPIEDVVYYANLAHASGCVIHQGDNLTGGGDGDDEQIIVNLENLPANYNKIVFVVTIYDAVKKQQHFGMIRNAFIRIVDATSNREICRYNLSENYEGKTSIIFGEVSRSGAEWQFAALGQATNDDLTGLINRYRR